MGVSGYAGRKCRTGAENEREAKTLAERIDEIYGRNFLLWKSILLLQVSLQHYTHQAFQIGGFWKAQ